MSILNIKLIKSFIKTFPLRPNNYQGLQSTARNSGIDKRKPEPKQRNFATN